MCIFIFFLLLVIYILLSIVCFIGNIIFILFKLSYHILFLMLSTCYCNIRISSFGINKVNVYLSIDLSIYDLMLHSVSTIIRRSIMHLTGLWITVMVT